MRLFRLALCSSGFLAAFLATGCRAETTTVAGSVNFDGKPVSGGSVILYCADKQIVRGIIDAEGRYSIPNVPRGVATITVQSHAKVPAGLRLSQKLPKNTIDTPVPPAADPEGSLKVSPIPLRYAHPEESGLSIDVDRDRMNFDINLAR